MVLTCMSSDRPIITYFVPSSSQGEIAYRSLLLNNKLPVPLKLGDLSNIMAPVSEVRVCLLPCVGSTMISRQPCKMQQR